jgi:superfamily II DNA or RNA helicase
MKYFGISAFGEKNRESLDFHRYVEFSGSISKEERKSIIDSFNNIKNKDGSLIRFILISPAGSEGISLKNVRQVHVMEPYWNEVRIEQLIGRAVRACYHKDIPIKDRVVDIFRYNAIIDDNHITTDQEIQEGALERQNLIDTFLQTIKEVAVDCELFKEHNMDNKKYNCFKFAEKSYFDQYVGPAYLEDIYYDKKNNNGSNDTNSILTNVKVVKIKYVKVEKGELTEPLDCWYNPISGTVYDYELKYPFGKVHLNSDGIPDKINKNTYVVDNIIVIPRIRNN